MSELPKGWVNTAIGTVTFLNEKLIGIEDNTECGFVPMAMVPIKYGEAIEFEKKTWEQCKKGYTQFKDNDVLLAKITPCFENGKGALVAGLPNGIGAGSTEFFVLRTIGNFVVPKYLHAFVKTKSFLIDCETNMSGSVGHKRVPKDYLLNYNLPLAPLKEQKRIVEKLDDVLAQVDAIKGRLDSIPAIIKRFRQSVLASAVSGKLTQTNLKKKKANLSQLGQLTGGKTPSKSNANFWEDGSILWISPKDMKSDVIEDSIDYITEAAITDGGMKYINKNSILMVTRSGILSHTFPVAITSKQVTINQDIKAFIPNQNEIIPRYALITLKGLGPRILRECSKSGTTVASVETKALVELEFALPPIQEQKEIVRLVDEYFALADTIEAQVNKARARVDKLTQSILAKAFRGELVPQDDNDEPAEKLLERIAQAKAEAEALAKAVKKAEAGKKRAAKTISK